MSRLCKRVGWGVIAGVKGCVPLAGDDVLAMGKQGEQVGLCVREVAS